MCLQILLPQMKDAFEILVTIEYSEEMDDADVVVRYSGESLNPLGTDNELSLMLARKATENIIGIQKEINVGMMPSLSITLIAIFVVKNIKISPANTANPSYIF